MKKIIGIDLGTTNSCIAVIERGQYRVLENLEGGRTTPSVVCFQGQHVAVGNAAKRQIVSSPKNTVYASKRLIGRKYKNIGEQEKHLPFELRSSLNGDIVINIDEHDYAPQQVAAEILKYLKKSAEHQLGEEIKDVIITVPAYFNDSQRQATKDAGLLAGLNVVRIINEPTAAAIAYGITRNNEGSHNIIVYDLGGGTLDVSIINMSYFDNEWQFDVLSTNGDTLLGGEDFDQILIDIILENFEKENGITLHKDPLALQRIKEAAEKAKIELSTLFETTVAIPYITLDPVKGPLHINQTLTRFQYEQKCEKLVEKLLQPCRTALHDAQLKTEDISDVLLVGGQSRAPLVNRLVSEFFKKEPRHDVSPDEAIAIGAAIQGSVLAGNRDDVLLIDVTPLSLGIELSNGITSVIIPKNTAIPTRMNRFFTTAQDFQSLVSVNIVQGERTEAHLNHKLGVLELVDIPPARAGMLKIDVAFDIDANGLLTVHVLESQTGKSSKVILTPSSGLTDADIQRMLEDAANFEEYDKQRRRFAELSYEREILIGKCEILLKEDLSLVDPKLILDVHNYIDSSKKEQNIDDLMKNLFKLNNALLNLSDTYFSKKN